jgi:hypothetical protein
MISNTFETTRFRVQITGATVWVESREGANWIFRNQHSLPLNPRALRGRSEASVLRAAVQHFERIHRGDKSLREALTGIEEVTQLPITIGKCRTGLLPGQGSAMSAIAAKSPRLGRLAAKGTSADAEFNSGSPRGLFAFSWTGAPLFFGR